jgi:hypothetical protein
MNAQETYAASSRYARFNQGHFVKTDGERSPIFAIGIGEQQGRNAASTPQLDRAVTRSRRQPHSRPFAGKLDYSVAVTDIKIIIMSVQDRN